MKELNPIIRNALVTALDAMRHYERSQVARNYAEFSYQMIPSYWEAPELHAGYVKRRTREQQGLDPNEHLGVDDDE